MPKIIYSGADITSKVQAVRCVHEMHAEGRSDRLQITFGDDAGRWDAWQPARGDVITVADGAASTGEMFVTGTNPADGLLSLQALAAPAIGFEPKSKAWENVTLHHVISDIASSCGLTAKIYGIIDQQYVYVTQDGESDYGFLKRLLMFESSAFMIYDRNLVCYSEPYIEATKPLLTIPVTSGTRAVYTNELDRFARSAKIESGIYSGEFTLPGADGEDLLFTDGILLGSGAEGNRFCRGLLRAHNKNLMRGWVKREFTPGIAPGSIAYLKNEKNLSWDGPVFITRVRHDGFTSTKVFFRKIPEGY